MGKDIEELMQCYDRFVDIVKQISNIIVPFEDAERIAFIALCAVATMRFFYDNFQNLFQTADIGLLLANIVPEDCLFVIIMRKSTSWEMI